MVHLPSPLKSIVLSFTLGCAMFAHAGEVVYGAPFGKKKKVARCATNFTDRSDAEIGAIFEALVTTIRRVKILQREENERGVHTWHGRGIHDVTISMVRGSEAFYLVVESPVFEKALIVTDVVRQQELFAAVAMSLGWSQPVTVRAEARSWRALDGIVL